MELLESSGLGKCPAFTVDTRYAPDLWQAWAHRVVLTNPCPMFICGPVLMPRTGAR